MLNICREHRGLTLVLHEDSRGGGGERGGNHPIFRLDNSLLTEPQKIL